VIAISVAVFFVTSNFVMFDTWALKSWPRDIRVNVSSAVNPSTVPGSAINDDGVFTPSESGVTPTPRGERGPDDDSRTPPYGPSNEESRPWACVNHQGIIVGHVVIAGCDRNDLDRARTNDVHTLILIRAEITIAVGFLSHTLDGIHDIPALYEYSVSELLSPPHVSGHLIEHAWEWQ
jgi:hypothetical protein